jgi:hypothetical protein
MASSIERTGEREAYSGDCAIASTLPAMSGSRSTRARMRATSADGSRVRPSNSTATAGRSGGW